MREPVCLSDVSIKGGRVVLGQNESAKDVRVDAVREGDVHQPVFPTEWNCGFRALLSERKQAIARTTAQDHCQQFSTYRHSASPVQFSQENCERITLMG